MFWKSKTRRRLTLKEVMVKNPKTICPTHHLFSAKKLMNDNNIRHLPVVEKGRVCGVISDRDVKVASSVYKDRAQADIRIQDIFLMKPYTAPEDSSLVKVLREMLKNRYGCVIAVKNHKVTGIFTMVDAGELLVEMLV